MPPEPSDPPAPDERAEQQERIVRAQTGGPAAAADRWEYLVLEAAGAGALQGLLNRHAAEGWRLAAGLPDGSLVLERRVRDRP